MTEFGYHKFQVQIMDERRMEIGYFALVISKATNELMIFL